MYILTENINPGWSWLSHPLRPSPPTPQVEEFVIEFIPLPSRLAQSETLKICENEPDQGELWSILHRR